MGMFMRRCWHDNAAWCRQGGPPSGGRDPSLAPNLPSQFFKITQKFPWKNHNGRSGIPSSKPAGIPEWTYVLLKKIIFV